MDIHDIYMVTQYMGWVQSYMFWELWRYRAGMRTRQSQVFEVPRLWRWLAQWTVREARYLQKKAMCGVKIGKMV